MARPTKTTQGTSAEAKAESTPGADPAMPAEAAPGSTGSAEQGKSEGPAASATGSAAASATASAAASAAGGAADARADSPKRPAKTERTAEPKTAEPKPDESRPAEAKPAEAKPAEPKSGARASAPESAGMPAAGMPPGAGFGGGRDEMAPVPMPVPQGSGGGFAAGLLGGALAVAAGIGILWVSNPDLLRGDYATELAPLRERVAAGAAETERLSAEVAALKGALEALPRGGVSEERIAALESEFRARMETVSQEVSSLSSALDVLEGRVGQVEVRPPVMGGDAAAASAEVVAEMRAALDAQRAEMERLIDETRSRIAVAEAEATQLQDAAAAAARATVARAAFSRLSAALDSGGPFGGALADLARVSDAPVPPALTAVAETGVPTLADLRRDFPAAAREALAASIRAGVGADAGAMERLGAFLRAQTGARSITAREGEDPDAVLSRVEAALAEGRLDAAISLLDLLPEEGRAPMALWRAEAVKRAGALTAAEALSAALPAN